MEFRRPSTLLMVSVKTAEAKRRIVVPIPLVLADAVAGCGACAFAIGRTARARWYKRLEENPSLKDLIPAVRALLRELRRAGPMTLVDVAASDGTKVVVRLV